METSRVITVRSKLNRPIDVLIVLDSLRKSKEPVHRSQILDQVTESAFYYSFYSGYVSYKHEENKKGILLLISPKDPIVGFVNQGWFALLEYKSLTAQCPDIEKIEEHFGIPTGGIKSLESKDC